MTVQIRLRYRVELDPPELFECKFSFSLGESYPRVALARFGIPSRLSTFGCLSGEALSRTSDFIFSLGALRIRPVAVFPLYFFQAVGSLHPNLLMLPPRLIYPCWELLR